MSTMHGRLLFVDFLGVFDYIVTNASLIDNMADAVLDAAKEAERLNTVTTISIMVMLCPILLPCLECIYSENIGLTIFQTGFWILISISSFILFFICPFYSDLDPDLDPFNLFKMFGISLITAILASTYLKELKTKIDNRKRQVRGVQSAV